MIRSFKMKAAAVMTALTAAFGFAVGASAAPAGLAEAAADAKLWQSLNTRTPGVYVTDGRVFSAVEVRYGENDRPEKMQIKADAEAVRQLAYEALAKAFPGKTAADVLGRRYVSGRVKFDGRMLESACLVNTCRSVFVTSQADYEKCASTADAAEGKRAAVAAFRSQPFASADVWRDLGLPETALLLEVRRLPKGAFNVKTAFLPSAKNVSLIAELYHKRSVLLSKLSMPDDLALSTLTAVDDPAGFARKLQQAGIAKLTWMPSQTLLNQAARVQGFVKLDSDRAGDVPKSMPFIEKCFSEGRDLELVVFMLENAAERYPANSQVWEYLAAGYLAAGQSDAARIAARVWAATAERPDEALLYLLKKFDDPRGAEVLSLLGQR